MVKMQINVLFFPINNIVPQIYIYICEHKL